MKLADDIFGSITQPGPISKIGDVENGGLGNLINLILKVMIIGAGLYALFNLVLAGYAFMSAGDDAKKVAGAWAKIWQTMLGLLFAAGSFVLAAIFGYLLFGDAGALLTPTIPTL